CRILLTLFGHELLNRSEDNTSARNLQHNLQFSPASRFEGRLSQHVRTSGKSTEQLIIEVVSVSKHNYRRILQFWLKYQAPGLAVDLRWRLKTHLRDHHGRSWNRFSVYLTIQERHLKELETLLLRITGKPPGNRVLGKFKYSENLKRRLKKDLRK